MSLSFSRFMANLEQLLEITFYLRKTENRTRESLTHLSHNIDLSIGTIFAKNAVIGKTKEVLVLKGIFFETTYAFVLTYQISSF